MHHPDHDAVSECHFSNRCIIHEMSSLRSQDVNLWLRLLADDVIKVHKKFRLGNFFGFSSQYMNFREDLDGIHFLRKPSQLVSNTDLPNSYRERRFPNISGPPALRLRTTTEYGKPNNQFRL
jgi:hypothetical protein